MLACRTVLRGFLTFMDITAIPAMPFYSSLFLKDCIFFYIIYQLPVTHLMELFHLGDFLKRLCYHGESLLFCDMCKSRIQGSPFKFFSLCSAKRLSTVFPITPAGYIAVISTFPPWRCLKNIFACSFSLSAVSRKIADICSNPSFFAALAK